MNSTDQEMLEQLKQLKEATAKLEEQANKDYKIITAHKQQIERLEKEVKENKNRRLTIKQAADYLKANCPELKDTKAVTIAVDLGTYVNTYHCLPFKDRTISIEDLDKYLKDGINVTLRPEYLATKFNKTKKDKTI